MKKPPSQTHVMVGLSGGVDSSVTAWLLQQQGYHVSAVFMQNWAADNEDPYCQSSQDLRDAQQVCKTLTIPLQIACFAEDYWNKVFQHFLDEYAAGRTPNPDILCNKEIKFRAFLDYAMLQGADYIATGHYARIERNDSIKLLTGLDTTKDQSYFLYTLQQEQLHASLFPLGGLLKSQVRKIAQDIGLSTHAKKDSTGICFIGERKFKEFISEYLLARPGNMEMLSGQIIAKHQGLMFYTIGQRQGLGIGGQAGASSLPWYVLDKDIERNVLIVGQSHDHPRLFKDSLHCQQLSWIAGKIPKLPLNCAAKTRYRQSAASCTIYPTANDCCEVRFMQPQWAITPGQSVVFYQDEVCLGGGIIN